MELQRFNLGKTSRLNGIDLEIIKWIGEEVSEAIQNSIEQREDFKKMESIAFLKLKRDFLCV